jgi:peptidoglycan biosynthesis protein MviN/MurJ (putative lipid II flippase)
LSTVVQATGHIRSAVASAVAASILQLTLTAALIGPMGLEGASFSFVLSSLLNAAGLAWGATRAGLLRWSDLLPARTALATAALAVLTLAAIAMDAKMRPDPWLTLAVMGVLSGLCGIAAWFLALDGPARRKLSQALGLRPPRPAQG